MTQGTKPGPIDMEGLTPLQQRLRRANRCRMEFVQAGSSHHCWLAAGHQGYHCVNEWGIFYWAHPLQKFQQSTEECMAQIGRGDPINFRAEGQTEEDARKLPYMEMDWSVPCSIHGGHSLEIRTERLFDDVSRLKSDLGDLKSDVRH